MPETSRARLFFDEIVGKQEKAFEFVSSLAGSADAVENGWRDYKEAGFIGRGTPDDDDNKVKKIWSENLSAFSNTSGGVLLWGFRTKGTMPTKLDLAQDCTELANRLRALVNDATDPYVAGVEVFPVRNPAEPKSGAVVCFIPVSSFPPHQANWGERSYFIRTQDSNLICPQSLLRNLFYPRALARLEPQVKFTSNLQQGEVTMVCEVRIRSLGPVTADVAIVQIEVQGSDMIGFHADHHWEEIAPRVVKYAYPLPPNFMPPHLITIRAKLATTSSSGLTLVFRFFTHNTPAHYASVAFSRDEVLTALNTKQPLHRSASSQPIYP